MAVRRLVSQCTSCDSSHHKTVVCSLLAISTGKFSEGSSSYSVVKRRPTFEEIATACETLGLDVTCNPQQLKERYHELVRRHHPDAGGDEAHMAKITCANGVLESLTPRERSEFLTQRKFDNSKLFSGRSFRYSSARHYESFYRTTRRGGGLPWDVRPLSSALPSGGTHNEGNDGDSGTNQTDGSASKPGKPYFDIKYKPLNRDDPFEAYRQKVGGAATSPHPKNHSAMYSLQQAYAAGFTIVVASTFVFVFYIIYELFDYIQRRTRTGVSAAPNVPVTTESLKFDRRLRDLHKRRQMLNEEIQTAKLRVMYKGWDSTECTTESSQQRPVDSTGGVFPSDAEMYLAELLKERNAVNAEIAQCAECSGAQENSDRSLRRRPETQDYSTLRPAL